MTDEFAEAARLHFAYLLKSTVFRVGGESEHAVRLESEALIVDAACRRSDCAS
jgi:hypothetical protein